MPAAEKKWDSNAERDLCLAIIMGNQDGERMRHNWPGVHTIMANLGYKFTKDAISQHFTKTVMREFKARHGEEVVKAGGSGNGNGSGSASGSTTVTPKKVATPRKRATPARAKKSKAIIEPEDEEMDDDIPETPSKKVKTDKGAVKTEEDSGFAGRERSATVAGMSNDQKFEEWVKEDDDSV